MEPVGFTVGFVGLAGLYSTCVDLFKTFRGMQSFDREHRILATKLDIEKELFLQWGEGVGALPKDRHVIDRRLLDPYTERVVVRVLEQVKDLLSDTRALERKYGLKAMQPRFRDENDGIVSWKRMSRFETSHRAFTQQTRYCNEQPSKLTRWRWTVHDKEKFESLLGHLSYFIGQLRQMIPVQEQKRMMNESLQSQDPQSLRLIEAAAKNIHDDWSDAASTLADESEAATWTTSDTYIESDVSDGATQVVRSNERRRSRSREETPDRARWKRSAADTAAEMMDDIFGFPRRR